MGMKLYSLIIKVEAMIEQERKKFSLYLEQGIKLSTLGQGTQFSIRFFCLSCTVTSFMQFQEKGPYGGASRIWKLLFPKR